MSLRGGLVFTNVPIRATCAFIVTASVILTVGHVILCEGRHSECANADLQCAKTAVTVPPTLSLGLYSGLSGQ
jgi:hypothetical protein